MIRLLLILCAATALGAVAAWLADHPGHVTMYWFDWRIDTSVAALIMLATAAILMTAYSYVLVRSLLLAPKHFSQRRHLRHYQKGLSEITYGVASLAAGDARTAQVHVLKAEKLLGQTPLTLLLSAQLARSNHDDKKTRLLLSRMLEHKETEYLAARSLSETASSERQFARALPMAERANAINPREKTAALALTSLHIRLGAWQEALQTVDRAARKGALLRSERRRYRGMVYLQQGVKLLENSQPESAASSALTALKHLPHFAPAVILAAKAHNANVRADKAIALIMKEWKFIPHPELSDIMRVAMAKQPMEKQLKLVQKLAARNAGHVESHLAIAETAIKFKQWELARAELKLALAKGESMRGCKLMAYVEQGEFSDFDAAGRWLARSIEASQDPSWHCRQCSHKAGRWIIHCDHCGALDSLEWHESAPEILTTPI